MSARKASIPVVLILTCAVVLLACNQLSTAMPSPSVAPSPPGNPSPTLPMSPTDEPTVPTPDQTQMAIPAVGEPAPDFSLPSTSSQAVSLSDYRGTRNVVLLFYRTGG
jgi:hypothetical protein